MPVWIIEHDFTAEYCTAWADGAYNAFVGVPEWPFNAEVRKDGQYSHWIRGKLERDRPPYARSNGVMCIVLGGVSPFVGAAVLDDITGMADSAARAVWRGLEHS